MALESVPQTRPPEPSHEGSNGAPAQVPAPASDSAPAPLPTTSTDAESEGVAADLLVYGTDEILKGTDTATLVAFAALAFQQIRGKGEVHHRLGCILLLLSVLMCAVVHLSIGNAYVGRARMILKKQEITRRQKLIRKASYGSAWLAAAAQFITLLGGLVLIMLEKPPALVLKYLRPFLQL